ncbi:hypothetical protein [Gelidibacter maritimus]|uniref:Uncharacterized protein n=1 Tax=Gelidibacter maritimus TaxID=2761487 RepID=A0A7W2M5Q1_9FLAO|nr:hypothetical protein [Gelidibacter maritimus]MBA6153168.1 hypothetical protein [Gelidibacter maritimus]
MENSKVGSGTSRREFMQQLALCYMAAHLPLTFISCSDDDQSYKGSGKIPYKVWEEMLMALQTCPDYLEGRMKALVASKDAEAMCNFVKDEIYLMPASNKAIGQIGWQSKWGIKGALRYGMATPREKAELLNQMYSEAGFTSKVMYERTNITPEEALTFFLRPIQRDFNLDVSKKQWQQWEKELNVDTSEFEMPGQNIDTSQATALADKLWNLIPDTDNIRRTDFDLRWDNYRTPTVQFEKDGATAYAHLFDPKIPFGKLKNDGALTEADAVKLNEETVEIKITYREAIHPDKELEMISGSWKARDLIGSQIHFTNLNGLDLEQSAYMPIGSLRIFTPTLAYQNFDSPLEFMEERSFVADPFTLEGEKIKFPDTQNGSKSPIIINASSTQLLKTVSEVSIKALPVNKTLVKLEVKPLNAEGQVVEGLQASDFAFADNKQTVQVLMESNQKTPSILILYDGSFSMPKAYYQENMDLFVASMEEKILENFPAARVDKWVTTSHLFTWLLKASRTSYDLVVFATDGHNGDVYEEKNFITYQNGPPVIVLNVYNSTETHTIDTFNQMAAVTNGSVIDAEDQAATLEKIVSHVNGMEIPPYTFSFYAIPEEHHEVELQMDQKRLSAKAEFTLELDSAESNQGIIGVYLNIKVGKTLVTRTLAGWDPILQRNQEPTNAHFLDVKSLIFGGLSFYFEGEGPTLATSIVDLLKYKLSTRGWGEALLNDDLETAKIEFEKGGYQYHSKPMSLLAPLDEQVTDNSFTFATGMRVCIYKQQLHIEDEKTIESFDFLPTSNYVSFTNGNADPFRINIEKTAQLAVREAALFDTSTLTLLNGISLVERTKALSNNWYENLDRNSTDYLYWYERIYRGDANIKIFDGSGTQTAFWTINPQGELYGILRNGTGGGGSEETIAALNRLMIVMRIYISVLKKMGALSSIGGMALSIVAVYGVTLAKLYAIVCESIIIMDTTGMDAKIAQALKELAFNVAKTICYGFGGSKLDKMRGLDHLINFMGGSTNPYS